MGFTWAITCAHNAMRSGEVPAGAISGTEAGVAGGGWAEGGPGRWVEGDRLSGFATGGMVDGPGTGAGALGVTLAVGAVGGVVVERTGGVAGVAGVTSAAWVMAAALLT